MENNLANVIERICRDLALPKGDHFTQDWIYELSEEFRTPQAFSKYLLAYSNPYYGNLEKRLLMQLMLDIVNDLLEQDAVAGRKAWGELSILLLANPELHQDQIEYWALPGEPLEDGFPLTSMVRILQAGLAHAK